MDLVKQCAIHLLLVMIAVLKIASRTVLLMVIAPLNILLVDVCVFQVILMIFAAVNYV
jgi:hypothetical protein